MLEICVFKFDSPALSQYIPKMHTSLHLKSTVKEKKRDNSNMREDNVM